MAPYSGFRVGAALETAAGIVVTGTVELPVRHRPSLQAVPSDPSAPVTVDLTAEDDTQTLPRLDSLEQKLKDLEQQFG